VKIVPQKKNWRAIGFKWTEFVWICCSADFSFWTARRLVQHWNE
jgi:hypothetical protein